MISLVISLVSAIHKLSPYKLDEMQCTDTLPAIELSLCQWFRLADGFIW